MGGWKFVSFRSCGGSTLWVFCVKAFSFISRCMRHQSIASKMAFLHRTPHRFGSLGKGRWFIDDLSRSRVVTSFNCRRKDGYGACCKNRSFKRSAASQGENSESVSRNWTEEEARSVLGVTVTTPFDEIVKAKNQLLQNPNLDKTTIEDVHSFSFPSRNVS